MTFISDSPIVQSILFDAYGEALGVRDADAVWAGHSGLVMAGKDYQDYARLILVTPTGNIITQDMASAAAAGLLPNSRSGSAFGYVGTASTSNVVVRGTTYVEQTSGSQRSVVSSSVNDYSNGTGTQSVRITYLDDGYNGPFTEDIVMNGTTPVNTVAVNMQYIEKMESLNVGPNGGNVGTISLKASTAGGGATIGSIAADDGHTYWAHHYVATGTTCYVTGMAGGVTGIGMRGFLRQDYLPNTSDFLPLVDGIMRMQSGSSSIQMQFSAPLVIVGPRRVEFVVKADASTAGSAFCSFNFYEVGT